MGRIESTKRLVTAFVVILNLGLPMQSFAEKTRRPTSEENAPAPMAEQTPADGSQEANRFYSSPVDYGLDLQFGSIRYPNYQFNPTVYNNSPGYALIVAFEYFAYKDVGKLALGLEGGAMVEPNYTVVPNAQTGDQVATLYTFPLKFNVTYRFDYLPNNQQILVPFVKVGPEVAVSSQRSNFGWAKSGVQRYFGFNYGAGLELGLNWIDPSSARAFDHSVGINATYIVFEYIMSSFIAGNADLSGQELRLGLRFEM